MSNVETSFNAITGIDPQATADLNSQVVAAQNLVTASQQRLDAATDVLAEAEQRVQQAQITSAQIVLDANLALTSTTATINTLAVNTVDQIKSVATQSVASASTIATTNITNAGTQAVTTLSSARDTALASINASRVSATSSVEGSANFVITARNQAVADVNTARDEAVASIAGGSVISAGKLSSARTLSWTGGATGSMVFDGTQDASAALTLTSSGVTSALGYTPASRAGGTLTGALTAPTLISTGNIVARAAAGEGGQIVLAYTGNTTAAGQVNSTWNIDVDATNALRVFRQNASGAVSVPLSVAEADGRVSVSTNLTVAGTASTINMVQDGTGGVVRNLVAKLKGAVSPEDFGAVGDGVADDTLAWQRAVATGRTVIAERSTAAYKITGRIRVATQRQKIDCGHARLLFSGTDAGFLFQTTDGTYLDSATLENVWFDAIGTTAGTLIIARRNARLSLRNIMGYNPWNFFYLEGTNVCSLTNVWINEVRGDYGVRWYGHTNAVDWGNGQTDTWLRNDVLRLANCTLSTDDKRANNQTVGIDWDGNCHSLATQSLILVGFKHAIHVRNTSNSTQVPSFGMFDNLECDFASDHSVRLDAGNNFFFTPTTYIHGSKVGSGIYIGPAVWNETVVVAGGKITGHARYGIEQPTGRCKVMNVTFSSSANGASDNSLGNTSGDTYITTNRVELDSQFYATRNNGIPTISFDQNDYLNYDRGTNSLNVVIAGKSLAQFKDERLYTKRVDWNANFYADGSATNPILAFDPNDYLTYDRAADRLDLIVGGASRLSSSGTALFSSVPLSVTTPGAFSVSSTNQADHGNGYLVTLGHSISAGGFPAATRMIHKPGVEAAYQIIVGGGADAPGFSFRNDGSAIAAGSWISGSDGRVKAEREAINGALSKVRGLTGYTYARTDLGDRREAGVIAQDLRDQLPEAVVHCGPAPATDPEGEGFLGVNYAALTALLVEGLKELAEEVAQLRGSREA